MGTGFANATALVVNKGETLVVDIVVCYHSDDTDLGTQNIPYLLPGKRTEITHSVWAATQIKGLRSTIQATADPDDTIIETAEENIDVAYLPAIQ